MLLKRWVSPCLAFPPGNIPFLRPFIPGCLLKLLLEKVVVGARFTSPVAIRYMCLRAGLVNRAPTATAAYLHCPASAHLRPPPLACATRIAPLSLVISVGAQHRNHEW